MKTFIYRRVRNRAHTNEIVRSKNDRQQEQTFFGENTHEPFFKTSNGIAAGKSLQLKLSDSVNEATQIHRTEDKKEEEKKVQRKEEEKEEKVQQKAENPEEEEKVQKKEEKEEEKVMKKEEKHEDEKDTPKAQRKEAVTPSPVKAGNYISSLNGKGNPLPAQANSFFSARMGHDFSNVKVHNDKAAADSAKEVNARAYTVGKNVIFNDGEYDTSSETGKKLLAHELAHVIQNGEAMNLAEVEIARQPADAGMDAGAPAAEPQRGPTDAGVEPAAGIGISPIASELAIIWETQGKGVFFERIRNLTEVERTDIDVINYVTGHLVGDDYWLASNLLQYGREINWPINLRVAREMKGWGDSGGFSAALTIINFTSDAGRLLVINDAALMQSFYTNLSIVQKVLLGTALFNLSSIATGVARNATAALFMSNELIDRNTAMHIANGRISVYYYESLQQPPNLAQVLIDAGLDASLYTAYLEPPENTIIFYVQLNAAGSQRGSTSKIMGRRNLSIDIWKNLLVHETSHARNVITRDTTAVESIERYKSEFRAYWVAEFRGVTDLAVRASQIKQHILNSYPRIKNYYDTNAAVKTAIDAHLTPDGNITNV